MNGPRTPALILCGPTASGKSSLAMRLAEDLGGEIVGADAVQIYKCLDIGSAKASRADRDRIRHHLVDTIELDADYDAGRYAEEALAAIKDIQNRGKVAIVCGGSGMYIRALLYGITASPPSDEATRESLRTRAASEGWPALHAELSTHDPTTAARVHPNDGVRVLRALEVLALTGKPLSAFQAEHNLGDGKPRFDALQVALGPVRERLYERINARVGAMFEAGWVDEVRQILDAGWSPDLKPLRSLGYRHLVDWLRGSDGDGAAFEETVRLIRRDHRRYAKRQMTWFRGQPHMTWFEAPEPALAFISQRYRPQE